MKGSTGSATAGQPRVVMVAAECRDLAKVGGLGDVVRELSKALKDLGTPISVVMPYYDVVSDKIDVVEYALECGGNDLSVAFGGTDWPVGVFRCELDGVPIYLLRSDRFFGGEYGGVYIDSESLGRGPFEDDAQRYAFFSAAALEFVQALAEEHGANGIGALHCHDWHTGALLVLLKHDPRYAQLAGDLRTLFTIHNLDYQGIRPFESAGDGGLLSFSDWFPALHANLKSTGALDAIGDPHTPVPCFNPMRAGINLADNVNTVSQTYAGEIAQPDDPSRNFIGGRGLEDDLQRLREQSRLHGILNGLDYDLHDPSELDPPFDTDVKGWKTARSKHKADLLGHLGQYLRQLEEKLGPRFYNRDAVLAKLPDYDVDAWMERCLVVAVTRAAGQKVSILLEALDGGNDVLDEIIARDLSLLVLGTGELQDGLEKINAYPNGCFVCAFDRDFAERLYTAGDLFLMPSDFEPCGISQMIAMRYGCLPLVHGIGGLRQTVEDEKTGFVYSGESRQEARETLLETLDLALDWFDDRKRKWTAMQKKAMAERFEWTEAAEKYSELYFG